MALNGRVVNNGKDKGDMVMDSVRHYYSNCVEVLRTNMKIVKQFLAQD
jgi:hypothetical protein